MRMYNRDPLILLTLLILGLALLGCELDPTDDASDSPGTPDAGEVQDDTQPPLPALRFVMVEDQSTEGGENPGADIDAIIVTKGDGTQFFGETVEGNFPGADQGLAADPTDLLGQPDAFYNWATGDTTVCDANEGFYNLGGVGGQVIVRMEQDMTPGDNLTVLEVGNCNYDTEDPDAIAGIDPIDIYVSVSSDPADQWIFVGTGTGPEVSFPIPTP